MLNKGVFMSVQLPSPGPAHIPSVLETFPPSTAVKKMYEDNEFFDHPQMEEVFNKAMEDPNAKIEIPDDFVSNTVSEGGFFTDMARKVQFFFQSAAISTKCLLSSEYREKHDQVIDKIEKAYSDKVSHISGVAHHVMISQEAAAKLKKELENPQVSQLNKRITDLKEELQSDHKKLESKLFVKDEIVQDARKLREKKEHLATDGEKFVKFWEDLLHITQAEPEIVHIQEKDKTDLVSNLTEDNIRRYEKGDYENSILLTEIRSLELAISAISTELQEAVRELARLESKNVKNLERFEEHANLVSDAGKEIERKKIGNFFEEDDIKVPEILRNDPSAAAAKVKDLSPREIQLGAMAKDIETKTGSKELATLLTTLIGRFPEDAIVKWDCDSSGNFTLKLKEPSYIWMPGKETAGGAILMFGHGKNGEVKGKLEKNGINFTTGANNYVNGGFPVGYLTTTFDGIKFNSKTDVQVGGTGAGFTRWVKKTFNDIKNDWSSQGTLVTKDNYINFLEDKAKKA